MHRMPVSADDKVSTAQMKSALKRAGYLLEQRVEGLLQDREYLVETNPSYLDPDTGKSREFDIYASACLDIDLQDVFKDLASAFALSATLICECENNSQPVVFFNKQSPSMDHTNEIRAIGMPLLFWRTGNVPTSIAKFAGMHRFHHYCLGEFSTQYCSFEFVKNGLYWQAKHPDTQHETFVNLTKALEYRMKEDAIVYSGMGEVELPQGVDIDFYYPLLVLQGDIYIASYDHNRLTLRKTNHAKFCKQVSSPRYEFAETYQIDVVTERYLEEYLKIIKREIVALGAVLRQEKANVQASIARIMKLAAKTKGNPKAYRSLFTM